MGCTTSTTEFQEQSTTSSQLAVLPLPIDIINAYIDRVSIVMINKIKDKFQSQLTQKHQEMDEIQFIHLFKNSDLPDVPFTLKKTRKKQLFAYFSNNTKRKLLISKFIEKYCILVKSDSKHFSQIIHRVYCKSIDLDKMQQQDYKNFQDDCLKHFNEGVFIPPEKFPLLWSHFYQFTKDSINWQSLQSSLQIVSIDELPYKSFHEELEKFNNELLHKGANYFIVSAEWISQWIFFYEYEDTDIKNSSYRSNKSNSLLRKKSLAINRKVSKPRLNSSKIISSQGNKNMQSLLPPTEINFSDIEGEYFGELKPLLIVERDIAVINTKMWTILKNTLGSVIQFEREAIDDFNVDLYPLFVYFYRVESNGTIDPQSMEIIKAKRTLFFTQFKKLIPEKKNSKEKTQNPALFYKNFEQKNFTQWNPQICLQQFIQENPRTIIVEVASDLTKKFISKYERQDLKSDNITIGDKVLAYFSYQDKYVQSYVINSNPSKKQLKVHFIGFSYNYEKWVKINELKLVENDTEENKDNEKDQIVNEKQTLFWGIPNIGNTCFLNSVLQSLVSTSIFDKFFLKADLSQKTYPLSSGLGKVVKGVLNRQKFSIVDFKKIVNTKMPIFSGYDQHDAQQFLNLLLDNMDEELKEKPNVVDELFCGVMESKFTCLKCKQVKKKQEKIHSISLPIPQNEYNYFVIMIFPIYSSSSVRKIILRLHKNAKISEYMNAIQERSGITRSEFLFVQAEFSTVKKFRNELTFQINQDRRVTDLGLNANLQIWAFEKLRNSSIDYQLKKKLSSFKRLNHIEEGHFYDFYSEEYASWGITRVIEITDKKIKLQFLKDNSIKNISIEKQKDTDDQFNEIGTKVVENVFRRVYMRRWSESTEKMVFFESQLFIGMPKWTTFKDAHVFFQEFLQKLKKRKSQRITPTLSSASKSNSFQELESQNQNILFQEELRLTGLNSTILQETTKNPYVIHFLQAQKNICFFCSKELPPFHSVDEIKVCCEPDNKQVPLYWNTQQKPLFFVVDWIDVEEYNEGYFHSLEMDNASIAAEQKMKSEKISLEQCLDMWKKPETIEMQCEKCKFNEHLLQTSIKKSPIITVFHLKQFRYTEEGHFIKLNINLEWLESINLQEYYSDPSPNPNSKGNIYEMYSVITHKGSTNSGHYTCMAKRKHPLERTKVWVNFDDLKTEIVTQKPETVENAYLLFFKKVDIPSSAVVHFSI